MYCKDCQHSYMTRWGARGCKEEKMLVADHGYCKNYKGEENEQNIIIF